MTPLNDIRFMRRAITLAERGLGYVSPNPLVGAVIVDTVGKIIGQGWHEKYGEAHAEVNAIRSVRDKAQLRSSTIYVTLEPCSHYGKTPPCCDLILKMGIPRVVIGSVDTNPKVSGAGIERLRGEGVEVVVGVEQSMCRELNKRFFMVQECGRPYVILKWAQSSDGYLDAVRPGGVSPAWFTGPEAKAMVHSWRAEEDAIVVGGNTARLDNPALTVREVEGRNPLRVVVSKSGDLDNTLKLFSGEADTILFSDKHHQRQYPNCQTVPIDFSQNPLTEMLTNLRARGINSLFVEGGAQLLAMFLKAELWDEARIFTAPRPLSHYYGELADIVGVPAPKMEDYLRPEEVEVSEALYSVGSSQLRFVHKHR